MADDPSTRKQNLVVRGRALPGVDPMHKVWIIPRGFGGIDYTRQRPSEDRLSNPAKASERKNDLTVRDLRGAATARAKDIYGQRLGQPRCPRSPAHWKETAHTRGIRALAASRHSKTGDVCDQLIAEPRRPTVHTDGFNSKEFLE